MYRVLLKCGILSTLSIFKMCCQHSFLDKIMQLFYFIFVNQTFYVIFNEIILIFHIANSYNIISIVSRLHMSRDNVFKRSGNMALNSYNQYKPQDISQIKSSLRLLKQKQTQKRGPSDILDSNLGYNPQTYNNNPKSEQNIRTQNHNNYNNYGKQDMYAYEMQAYPKQNYVASYKQLNKQQNLYQEKNSRNQLRMPCNNKPYQDKNQYYPSSSKLSRNQAKNSKQLDSYNNYDYQPSKQVTNDNTVKSRNLPPRNYNKPQNNYNQYSNNQNRMEKPIRQANRQNKVDIVEYDPREFVACRQGCGRKFNPDSISKHEAICKKVFQKKRKQFDSQKHRLVEKEQLKLIKKGQEKEKKIQIQKAKEKIPKWKAQSMALRVGLKHSKNLPLSAEDKKMVQMTKQAEQNSKIKCPHCGRTFNQTAGPRHIDFCATKQKNMVNKKKK